MYEAFFNLRVKPFELLPNPEFLFPSKTHMKALTYLHYGISERAGFILLTGEVGSGKTTLVRALIKRYHDEIVLAKIFNTRVDSGQLLTLIADDFGLDSSGKDKIALLRDLNTFLINEYAKGTRPVLIVDEAQNLGLDLLEELRLLSNLETDNAKLLQIILVGQPELRNKVGTAELLQLRQRISIYCHLQPLSPDEVSQYILHRFEQAGNREALAFSQEAIELIQLYSRGIPRLINIICDFILLTAFAERTREIPANLVHEILTDLDFENRYWSNTTPVRSSSETLNPGSPQNIRAAGTNHDIKRLLAEISQRLSDLEQTDPDNLEDIRIRLECYDKAVREYWERTTLVLADIKKNLHLATDDDDTVKKDPFGGRKGFIKAV